ncbi:lipase family protein [Cytobacillus sp. FSL R5-0596]|uniref:lipase family protein n=1 Tax=Cytobacillus sp. FSL R5-0596 TaxID=2954696 RepID=UPI0030F8D2A9
MTKIEDKFYLFLSRQAYAIDHKRLPNFIKYNNNQKSHKWEVVKNKEYITTDPTTGFDAFVVKNKDQIVVAFRGTQGDDMLGAGMADLETDIQYIVMKDKVHQKQSNPRGDRLDVYYNPKENVWYKKNQFQQAEKLISDIKKDNPSAQISVTGHSLGGALAQYAAAKYELGAVTYSAPSVIDLLDEKTKAKAVAGDFDSSIVNYIHPKDSIGAGGLELYERHIGSTYYIGSRFKYENMDNEGRPIKRLLESVASYHGMENYSFDKYGNINNAILYNVLVGVEVHRSPRYVSAEAGLIHVTPSHLLEVAESVEKVKESIMDELPDVKNKIKNKLIHGGERPETIDIGYEVFNELIKMENWLNEETSKFSHFLRFAAKEFKEADKLV